MFRCKACYFIYDGEDAPALCPKCGAPKEIFEQVPEATAALILRSRKGNDLLIKMAALLEDVKTVASEGVKENLDPACLQIFQRIEENSLLFKNIVITEIQSHVSKTKWG